MVGSRQAQGKEGGLYERVVGHRQACWVAAAHAVSRSHGHALPHNSPSPVLAAQVDLLRALGILQAVRSTTWSSSTTTANNRQQVLLTCSPQATSTNNLFSVQQHTGMHADSTGRLCHGIHPPAMRPRVTDVPAFMMLVEAAGKMLLKDRPWAVPATAPPVCLKGSAGQTSHQVGGDTPGRQPHTHTVMVGTQ